MRLHPVSLITLVAAIGALSLNAAEQTAKSWVSRYGQFTRQKEIPTEFSDPTRRPQGNLTLREVIEGLPDPKAWREIKDALALRERKLPNKTLEKKRMQAGEWLMSYLLDDRAAIQTGIEKNISEETDQESGEAGRLKQLLQSLQAPDEPGPAMTVKDFEAALIALEPVSEAEVRKALETEANFDRLKRVTEQSVKFGQRMQQIFQTYDADKNEAAVRTKLEAAQREFDALTVEDRKALERFRENATVRRYVALQSSDEGNFAPDIIVPDLVTLVGRERAEALLQRAFRLPVKLRVENGNETRRLACDVAMAALDTLKTPQWRLVADENSVGLFEALRNRFPPNKSEDFEYKAAAGWYLGSLVVAGREADALRFATGDGAPPALSLPYELLEKMERTGLQERLWRFLQAWLPKNPGSDEWDRFNRLSVQLGHQKELAQLLQTMAANDSFGRSDWIRVQRMQANAELATDRLDAASVRLRAILRQATSDEDLVNEQMEISRNLLALADLQENAALYSEVLPQAEAMLEGKWARQPTAYFSGVVTLIGQLNGQERYQDVARVGGLALERVELFEKRSKPDAERDARSISSYDLPRLLIEVLCARVELGQWREAETLLQNNSHWGAADVAGILSLSTSALHRPAGYYAARVALARGDKRAARRLLEAQLVSMPASDPAYREYVALAGTQATALFDQLYLADRYQERPLIWKSQLLVQAGKLDEAAATLQQAIEIDPSDGEEGRGDRMRVYAFMSEVMAAKGDAAKAKFFADVVKAIRISENADRWFELGAYERAIRLYRTALGSFQDAYCIQSRLAVRLAAEGKTAEALEHYRRAFELMPGSFGRVESHCFGCEHVFSGEKPRGIAEEVFTKLLKEQPAKPQVHYLFGYLREEQDRPKEAGEHYRKATELDPFYLNAWNKLRDLDQKLSFTARQRDDLELKLLELDPEEHHVAARLQRVSDLPRLWHAMRESRKVIQNLPRLDRVQPLAASAKRIRENPPRSAYESSEAERRDFSSVLVRHDFVRALQIFLADPNSPGSPEAY